MKKFLTLCAATLAAVSMASAQDGCYVIGEVNGNGWDPAVGVAMTEVDDDIYSATVNVNGWFGVTLGLASSWGDVNKMRLYPADGNSNVTLVNGKAVIALSADNKGADAWTLGSAIDNVKLTVDLNAYTLTIETPTDVEIDENIYLVGELSGWGFEPKYKMTNDNNVYTINNVEIKGEFKLANPGWGKYNYGCLYEGDTPVHPTVGTEYEVKPNSTNLIINNNPDETYTVNVKLDLSGEKPMLLLTNSSSSVDATVVDNNTPAVYYNLQGEQVANPANGLFILKQGEKATKVVVK